MSPIQNVRSIHIEQHVERHEPEYLHILYGEATTEKDSSLEKSDEATGKDSTLFIPKSVGVLNAKRQTEKIQNESEGEGKDEGKDKPEVSKERVF
ncbi:hypothetical protein FACS1894152_1520 [Bacilli bacterium]|nr:hypothetical protein FACS1894152_1520 [Bacilli bacterium]